MNTPLLTYPANARELRRRIQDAVAQVDEFEELPADVQALIVRAEAELAKLEAGWEAEGYPEVPEVPPRPKPEPKVLLHLDGYEMVDQARRELKDRPGPRPARREFDPFEALKTFDGRPPRIARLRAQGAGRPHRPERKWVKYVAHQGVLYRTTWGVDNHPRGWRAFRGAPFWHPDDEVAYLYFVNGEVGGEAVDVVTRDEALDILESWGGEPDELDLLAR